jgi:hypothetical protein
VLLLLVLLVVGMSLAGRAQAAQPRPTLKAKAAAFNPGAPQGAQLPGQRPASDPWLAALMESGREFWASRGVQLPENVPLDLADDLRLQDSDTFHPDGRGWSRAVDGQDRVALRSGYVAERLSAARKRQAPTRARRSALKEVAALLLHEMGHVGGLHTDGTHQEPGQGFMALNAGQHVPQETARVIRRLVRRRPGERSSGGMAGVG